MKITALILAAALPFSANAERTDADDLVIQMDALAIHDGLSRDQFRSIGCYGAIKRGAARAALGAHIKEFRAIRGAVLAAKAAASCEAGTHGLFIYGDAVAEGRLTCREAIWFSWSGYKREEYICKPAE